jgi:hypothetical protein
MVRLLDQVMVPRVPTRKERTEIERMDHRTAQPNQARVCAESTVYTVCVEPQGIAPVRLRLPSPDSWRRHRGQEGGSRRRTAPDRHPLEDLLDAGRIGYVLLDVECHHPRPVATPRKSRMTQ